MLMRKDGLQVKELNSRHMKEMFLVLSKTQSDTERPIDRITESERRDSASKRKRVMNMRLRVATITTIVYTTRPTPRSSILQEHARKQDMSEDSGGLLTTMTIPWFQSLRDHQRRARVMLMELTRTSLD